MASRPRTSRSSMLCAVACVVLASLGPPAQAEPVRERPAEPERWRITGRPQSDGCGGRIHLAARYLTFRGERMHADVVDRTYRLRRRGDTRIAEGRFESSFSCDGTRLFERWTLREVSDGVLQGTLTSTWRLRPGCSECTITFAVRAVRVGG